MTELLVFLAVGVLALDKWQRSRDARRRPEWRIEFVPTDLDNCCRTRLVRLKGEK